MIETRLFRDYYSKKMLELFPLLKESSIRSILDHGARNMLKILSTNNDIAMLSEDNFMAFAGKIIYDQEKRDERAKFVKRRKIKSRRLATCGRFTKTYYMAVKRSQINDVFVVKNYNGLKLYKMLEEAKGCSCMYIFKVELKEIEKKHVINFFNHETNSIECFLRWSQYGYKRTDHTGEYLN